MSALPKSLFNALQVTSESFVVVAIEMYVKGIFRSFAALNVSKTSRFYHPRIYM
jgi:hypothetical protein